MNYVLPVQSPAADNNWASVVWEAAERSSARVAIVDGDTSVDYGRLRDRAATYAHLLTETGTVPGDRVVLWFRRSWDAAAALLGTWATGAVAVVLADVLRPRQVNHVIADSGANVLLVGSSATQPDPAELDSAPAVLTPPVDTATPFDVVPRRDDELAQLVYTSGSTGLPKGVMVSHGNLHAGVQAVRQYLGVRTDDRLASLLPFSFDYGLNQLLVALAATATLVIERSPIAGRIDRTLRSADVSVLAAVPPLWQQLLDVPSFRREPIASLRLMTNTGGRLPTQTVHQLRAGQPQAALFSMYGLTEAFRSTYLDPSQVDRKPASVGRAIPGAHVRVVRPDGSTCRPFEVGEIVHRGPTVTLGYWRNEAATQQVFRPVFAETSETHRVAVHSGDYGWVDDDGDLYVQGRRDRMIKRLGYRISPDEVAEAVLASGLVRDACVTTTPSDDGQDTDIVGHVALLDGATLEDLASYVAKDLPRYLRPSRFVEHHQLPTTANGKHDLQTLQGVPG